MAHVDDLSCSLVALDQQSTLTVAVALSQSRWLIAGLLPGVDRQPLKTLAPDPVALVRLLERWRDEAAKAGRTINRIVLAYEAGRDGFWLARWLQARGDRGVRDPFNKRRRLPRAQARQDRSARYGHADARLSRLAAR